ncbi:acetyl-CoA carboxylase biotin carboxylase subunit family protein [Streptomyces sp. NPDC050516]|uniref:acetyl-CoA carboxylase biotin carboxylase subunit family protein n=1 Tax=Streptomyces sp. NPDC050516 TaxID=3365621 RepID=UPI0037AC516F
MGTVIVLGYRKGIADAVARRGLDVFHVERKAKEALAGTRFALVDDLEDAQEVLRTVLGAGLTDVVGVVTGHEQGVFTAALLRDHLGLPGDRDWARALRFRDKYLQKAALPPDVQRARCEYVGPHTTYAELAAGLGTPFVVKPANGAGSVGAAAIGSEREFVRHLGPRRGGADAAWVAESFVGGREFNIDGVWSQGRLRWCSVSRFHERPMSTNTGAVLASQVLSRKENAEFLDGARALAERALGGLGAPDCVFHLEAFEDGDDLVFGECGTRTPGAHHTEIVQLTHGVDLYDLTVGLALGEDAADLLAPKDPDAYFAYIYLRRFEGVELTRADFEKHFSFHELSYPDTVGGGGTGSYGRAGHALVSAPDNARLGELMGRIVEFNESGRV